jgi:hypothetical protein
MTSIVRGTSIVLSVGMAVLVAGCSSSGSGTTGPTPPTASAATLHLDSLWAASNALYDGGDGDVNYEARTEFLTLAEAVTAYGAAPSFYSVNLNGTTQTWTGVALAAADDGDSEIVNILWDDANADNMLIAELEFGSSSTDTTAGVVASDTILVDPTTLSYTAARVGTGSGTTCTLQSGLQNTDLSNIFGGDTPACSPTTVSSSVSFTSTPPAGAEPGLASIAFSNSKESGEYFLDVTDPMRVPSRSLAAKKKIFALLQAIHATLRKH